MSKHRLLCIGKVCGLGDRHLARRDGLDHPRQMPALGIAHAIGFDSEEESEHCLEAHSGFPIVLVACWARL